MVVPSFGLQQGAGKKFSLYDPSFTSTRPSLVVFYYIEGWG
jgi:hypothetical protein